jgi:predicted transcriptional regulator of viral defense system
MRDNIPSDTWTHIVAELTDRLRAPSENLPNVQWLSESRLIDLLVSVRNTVKAPKALTGAKLLALLTDSKLVRKLPPGDFSEGRKPCAVYFLKIGGIPSISPVELLQATQPSFQRTVVCYFTALAYHELTTQKTPYHHVAAIKTPAKRLQSENGNRFETSGKSVRKPSLGTLLFRYQGVPYYVTCRDPALMPGIQTVRLSPSCLVRMTTLEQTLLDTLHRPWSCGGPSVVFEAWARGLPVLDDGRLALCLRKINRTDFTRRVGYMLDHFDHAATDSDLRTLMTDAKTKVKCGTEPPLSLLADVPSTVRNEAWGITA